MQSFIIRVGLAAAAVIAIAVAATPQVRAQNAAALSANPELAAKGVWNPATTYAVDDIVTARGSAWISLEPNNIGKVPGQTGPSTANFWKLFARGFNPLGAWLNGVTYHPDDLVTHNGQTYRAKITNINKQPTNTTRWELLVARGATGPAGLQGDQGIQGPPGPNTGVAAGTANAPAISFAGDGNTGIYSPADGKIALVEDGQLFLHSTGTFNTGVGSRALPANNTGAGNTAVGSDALGSNTGGSHNTAVGFVALLNSTGGSDNTALGSNALRDSNATSNTAVGRNALAENTNGGFNTAVGHNALTKTNNGGSNTAVGNDTLSSNTIGVGNVALGRSALSQNIDGLQNVAAGHMALTANTSGQLNTGLGSGALFGNTTGNSNTAIGRVALAQNTTGSSNVAVGVLSGANATSSSNSIFIGNEGSGADTATIKIGTNDTQTRTFIAGIEGRTTGVADAIPVLIDSDGQLGTANSSRRYKYDIETMTDMSAMLGKLRPVTFRYKASYADGGKPIQYGLIAEEVADIFPDLAVFNADRQPETVKYHLLPSFLLAGYQAQQNTIAAQADELRQQKEVNASLEARLARLEALLPQTRAALQ